MAVGTLSSYNLVEFTFEAETSMRSMAIFLERTSMGICPLRGTITVTLYDDNDYTGDLICVLSNPTGMSFIGFISDQLNFKWIDLDSSFTTYTVFDNLVAGTAVPEPSIALLLRIMAIGGFRSRRSIDS